MPSLLASVSLGSTEKYRHAVPFMASKAFDVAATSQIAFQGSAMHRKKLGLCVSWIIARLHQLQWLIRRHTRTNGTQPRSASDR
ncbi:hypothetical protein [Nitrosomonas sp. Nm34]|uniref:hypothetical protein n=1 Tax=Nitrosomonas sp. Nm34 TaxID=1881055 RepID=UPI000B89EC0A|nr:hypothetical protein [Nitrosomonas sp. Nm34]